jgi:hypothetical protein
MSTENTASLNGQMTFRGALRFQPLLAEIKEMVPETCYQLECGNRGHVPRIMP